MLDNKAIGKKIKSARELMSDKIGEKYTGQMLAEELGISRGFLGDIESGRKSCPKNLLIKIIEICDLQNDFFTDKPIEPPIGEEDTETKRWYKKYRKLTDRDKKFIDNLMDDFIARCESEEENSDY